jgi:hypothetical protein
MAPLVVGAAPGSAKAVADMAKKATLAYYGLVEKTAMNPLLMGGGNRHAASYASMVDALSEKSAGVRLTGGALGALSGAIPGALYGTGAGAVLGAINAEENERLMGALQGAGLGALAGAAGGGLAGAPAART